MNNLYKDYNKNCSTYMAYAEKEFNDRVNNLQKTSEFLSGKKFKLGQVVYVEGTTPIGYLLGEESNSFGIIVGHGLKEGHDGDYYRVHFNDEKGFSGVNENMIRELSDDEEIPTSLKNYTFYWSVGKYSSPVASIETFK